MLRNTFSLILITFLSFSGISQEYSLGIQGGLNLSSTNESYLHDSNFGFSKGISVSALFAEHYLVELNISTTTLGYRINYRELSGLPDFEYIGTYEAIVNFHYATVPIKFGYVIGDKIKFIPKIGIQSSLLKEAELIETVQYIGNNPFEENRSVKHNTKPFDIAVILETELRCKMSEKFDLSLSFGALHSLTSYNRSILDPNIVPIDSKSLHKAISLGIGLKYKL